MIAAEVLFALAIVSAVVLLVIGAVGVASLLWPIDVDRVCSWLLGVLAAIGFAATVTIYVSGIVWEIYK